MSFLGPREIAQEDERGKSWGIRGLGYIPLGLWESPAAINPSKDSRSREQGI